MDCHGNRMASCCLLLFFVFLKLISLSEEGCYDYFSRDKWNGADVTDLIPVINTTSLQGTLKCTLWKNKERKLFQKIRDECYEKEDLEETCNKATYHTMYMFHFRCLFAKLENVNCTGHTTFGDCQNFSSVVETMEWLWRISDGTSAGATSTSPPTMSTLTPITTSTISTPNISTSPNKASLTTNSTTTSTSPKTITSTASPTTMSMSLGTTTSTASPTTSTSGRTTTLTTSSTTMHALTPITTSAISTPTMSMSLGTTTSTASPTTTSTSVRTTTLTSSPTMSALTPTTTSTISTPTISTSRNTSSLTTSSTTTLTPPRTTTSSPTSSVSHRTTMSTRTTLKSRRTSTSTRSPTTTSRSSLTTQSTVKGQTQLSNTATLQSPMDVKPGLACHSRSASDVGPRKDSSTETPAPLRGHSTSILVLLILSITANIMQWLNSFLQKRRLKKKQKQMPAEYISLNPDAAAAENSPEKSLSYSNETVN
ncbi:cell wall protein DAN4-like isoform X2 [Xiphophorus maculatus]|uniref:cell wall protein DAN4-like isoform X2 n=1 Tax=Xiphophorus maculatus TaxID=8083 RepID=UPI000C6D3176|nr:cell wall protein DAN4-like isoform X2 [Xiphophorus maculatus]